MQALLFLAALCSAALPAPQRFRAAAGLPLYDPAKLSALNPATFKWAGVEAAHDLLATIPPAFKLTPSPMDPPKIAELKAVVAEARAVVAEARTIERLSEFDAYIAKGGEEFDQKALDGLYAGSDWSGGANTWLKDLTRDGAAAQAVKLGKQLKLPRHQQEKLAVMKPAAGPSSIERRFEQVRMLLKKGDWSSAWAAAQQLGDMISDSGLRPSTRLALGVEALTLLAKAKEKGAPRLYGSKSAKTGERVAVQDASDCAVHQLYNHPALQLVAALVGYHDFLRAVEKRLDSRVRNEGMTDWHTSTILKDLGYDRLRLSRPKDSAELKGYLEEHGPLMVSIRWDKSRGFRDRHGNHAVLIKEAQGNSFVVIDSNYSRPQLLTLEELGVLGASDFAAAVPVKDADQSALARAFVQKFVPPPAPWWRRFLGLD